jgi:hypothetical protein
VFRADPCAGKQQGQTEYGVLHFGELKYLFCKTGHERVVADLWSTDNAQHGGADDSGVVVPDLCHF